MCYNLIDCCDFLAKTKVVVIIAVIVAFVVGLVVGIFVGPSVFFGMHRGQFTGPGGSASRVNSASTIGTLFANSQFASSSYLISGNSTPSASGKVATSDFNLTTTPLANGSIEYSIKFDETGTTYNVTISHGDKLYYIDTSLGDDAPGSDISLGDDGYAVVNSTGYIVAYRYSLPNS